jgi:hypothetical protein
MASILQNVKSFFTAARHKRSVGKPELIVFGLFGICFLWLTWSSDHLFLDCFSFFLCFLVYFLAVVSDADRTLPVKIGHEPVPEQPPLPSRADRWRQEENPLRAALEVLLDLDDLSVYPDYITTLVQRIPGADWRFWELLLTEAKGKLGYEYLFGEEIIDLEVFDALFVPVIDASLPKSISPFLHSLFTHNVTNTTAKLPFEALILVQTPPPARGMAIPADVLKEHCLINESDIVDSAEVTALLFGRLDGVINKLAKSHWLLCLALHLWYVPSGIVLEQRFREGALAIRRLSVDMSDSPFFWLLYCLIVRHDIGPGLLLANFASKLDSYILYNLWYRQPSSPGVLKKEKFQTFAQSCAVFVKRNFGWVAGAWLLQADAKLKGQDDSILRKYLIRNMESKYGRVWPTSGRLHGEGRFGIQEQEAVGGKLGVDEELVFFAKAEQGKLRALLVTNPQEASYWAIESIDNFILAGRRAMAVEMIKNVLLPVLEAGGRIEKKRDTGLVRMALDEWVKAIGSRTEDGIILGAFFRASLGERCDEAEREAVAAALRRNKDWATPRVVRMVRAVVHLPREKGPGVAPEQ